MNRSNFIFILILIACLPACSSFSKQEPPAIANPSISTLPPLHQEWWNKAIFYEIFVRSFFDSNADGIGDFNGITAKLDYIQNLGINAIWLMPINPSPTYHGYDVIDYYNVNPQYGTMDDFKRLLSAAHARGMRVIIDLVLNHTSSQNPWFVDANNDPQSPYRDWFIWSNTDPGYAGPLGNAWHAGKHGYYYGIFGDSMPDFNYKNPAVTREMEKVTDFWLKVVGVDGFRLDAVKYLVEDGQKQENTTLTHAWLKGFFTSYKSQNPQAYTIGEVYGADAALAKTYTGDQVDQIFEFELASGMVNSTAGEANSGINSALTFVLEDLPGGQFATFLTNHDQNRVMSDLNGSLQKARVAAALLFTTPGTPYIYYGEEIGMQGKKPDEDIRLPMQWSADANAGFTSGTAWRAPANNYMQANVATESNDPNSLLSFYRNLIILRKQHPALQLGSLSMMTTTNPGVYAVLRTSDTDTILVLINLTKNIILDYSLGAKGLPVSDGKYALKALLGAEQPSDLTIHKNIIEGYKPLPELSAYGVHIFELTRK